MKHETNSELIAQALANKIVQELGRLVVQRNRDNRDLTRLFRRIGLDRRALGVPVYKLGDRNEDSNVIELTNVVHDSGDRNWMRFDERMEGELRRRTGLESARRTRLNGED